MLQNGRLKGDMKKTLRSVIQKYNIPVMITANQNLVLREIEPAWRPELEAAFKVRCIGSWAGESVRPLVRWLGGRVRVRVHHRGIARLGAGRAAPGPMSGGTNLIGWLVLVIVVSPACRTGVQAANLASQAMAQPPHWGAVI